MKFTPYKFSNQITQKKKKLIMTDFVVFFYIILSSKLQFCIYLTKILGFNIFS